jgi:FKBP-type peptidyl-prolyl cis-trans isomerase|eukprot:scaffold10223_cov266-Chaetoceros_neogracile.AAC.3
MGRRNRAQSDEYDDSVERHFFAKQKKARGEPDEPEAQSNNDAVPKSAEEIERLRVKKAAKKLRQREKKLAAKKEVEKMEAAEAVEKEELEKHVKAEKKQKKIDKKEPALGEFIKTHKGVKYCDVEVGKGSVIQDRKKVRVKYVLRANDKKGKIIDSGQNFAFVMGKGEVISGWEIGLIRMKQGGTRHIVVPPKAGYGSKDIGGGPNAILYFEVKLLHC